MANSLQGLEKLLGSLSSSLSIEDYTEKLEAALKPDENEEDGKADDEAEDADPVKNDEEWISPRYFFEEDSNPFQSTSFLSSSCFKDGKRLPKAIESVDKASQMAERFRSHLKSKKIQKPTDVQQLMWPSILKGRSVSCISSSQSGKTVGYLVPILNSVFQKYMDDRHGFCESPSFVVVCSDAKNVKRVQDLICKLNPVGQAKITYLESSLIPPKIEKQLAKGCDIVVGTAPAIAKALFEQLTVLDKCLLLVIDNADKCFMLNENSVIHIYTEYVTIAKSRLDKNIPSKNALVVQTVICAEKFTNAVKKFIEMQHNPVLLIGDYLEAAVFGGIECRFQFCDSDNEREVGLYKAVEEAIDFSDRLIVYCRDEMAADHVHVVLQRIPEVLLKRLTGSTPHFDIQPLVTFWSRSPQKIILIVTDNVDIMTNQLCNGTIMIHHDMPDVKTTFSRRFQMMSEKLRDVNSPKVCWFVFSPENVIQADEISCLVKRIGQSVPKELKLLSNKKDKVLCETYATTGVCNLKPLFCSKRHVIVHQAIGHILPKDGCQIKFVITHVLSPGIFWIRIEGWRDDRHAVGKWQPYIPNLKELNSKLEKFMQLGPVKNLHISKVRIGQIFAVSMLGHIHRVRVVDIKTEQLQHYQLEGVINVKVHHIDFGYTTQVGLNDLMELIPEISQIPDLSLKVYLIGIKPIDNDVTWSSDSVRFFESAVHNEKNVNLTGWVVLQSENCLWLDSVKVTHRLDALQTDATSANLDHDLISHKQAMPCSKCLPFLSESRQEDIKQKWKLDLQQNHAAYAFLEPNSVEQVSLIHYVSPKKLFLRLNKFQRPLHDLEKAISQVNLLPVKKLCEGLICLAKCEIDGSVNRAIITRLVENSSTVDVFYLDHGEEFEVDRTDCNEISMELIKQLPFQAIKCSLHNFAGEAIQSEDFVYDVTRDENDIFKILLAKRVERIGNLTFVRIFIETGDDNGYINYTSLAKMLMDKSYGISADDDEHLELRMKKAVKLSESDDEEIPAAYETCEANFLEKIENVLYKTYVDASNGLNIDQFKGKTCNRELENGETEFQQQGNSDEPATVPYQYGDFNYEVDRSGILCFDPSDRDNASDAESDEELYNAQDF
ncbi:putative ATP-dependent RNA helicase TDRD12 [Halotydeus destructor]|nr:putative ATP-dependent RNA helicase TDRD12 [Halotydeus destructor]